MHPKLAGVIDLFLGLVFLFWIKHIGVWWVLYIWFFARVILWGALMVLVYYPQSIKRFWHLLSLAVFNFGALLLLLFIEWNYAWETVALVYLVFPLISFWLLPTTDTNLSFEIKSYRRWRFWLSLFGLFGVWSGIFSALSLQISTNVTLFILLGTVASTAVAMWWWQEYNIEKTKLFWLWSVAFFVLILEIVWAIYLWPLGYFTNAFLAIWFWYNIWLLVRFHLLQAGIKWDKQIYFFGINTFLFLVFLIFIVRWK